MKSSHYDSIPESPVKRRSKRAIWYVAGIGLAVSTAAVIYMPRIATWAILTGFVAAFTYVYLLWRTSSDGDR